MVSLNRKVLGALASGFLIAIVFFLLGTVAVAAVPGTLPATTPVVVAAAGFIAPTAIAFVDDLKDEQAATKTS